MRFEELPEDLTSQIAGSSILEELSCCILPIIETLPNIYQRPLILSEVDGKKFIEVAEELDLTLSAVKSRIKRGREKIHKHMVACCSFYHDSTGNIFDYEEKGEGCSCDCGKKHEMFASFF